MVNRCVPWSGSFISLHYQYGQKLCSVNWHCHNLSLLNNNVWSQCGLWSGCVICLHCRCKFVASKFCELWAGSHIFCIASIFVLNLVQSIRWKRLSEWATPSLPHLLWTEDLGGVCRGYLWWKPVLQCGGWGKERVKWTSLLDCLTKSFLIDTGRGDFQWPVAPQQCLVNKTISCSVWYMNVALLTRTHAHTHTHTHTHNMHTRTHALTSHTHACMHAHTHTHTHTHRVYFTDIWRYFPMLCPFLFLWWKKRG